MLSLFRSKPILTENRKKENMSTSTAIHSNPSNITLRDHSQVPSKVFEKTLKKISELKGLGYSGEYVLIVLVKKCSSDDQAITLTSSLFKDSQEEKAENVLKKYRLINEDGNVNDDIRSVVLNSLEIGIWGISFTDSI